MNYQVLSCSTSGPCIIHFCNDMHLAGGVTAKMAQSSSGAAAGEGVDAFLTG